MHTNPLTHREFAVSTYNGSWNLLDRAELSAEEQIELERMACASLYHWSVIGGAQELATGEWLLARVYIRLGFGHEALRHASMAAELASKNEVADYLKASTLEGLARAHAMMGIVDDAIALRGAAVSALDEIVDPEDRELIESQISEGPWFGI